jgi:hypothetical protein
MLASDLMNPQFVGARNPDELLQAEFNWREVKTMFGKPVLDKDGKPQRQLFVRISSPGNDTSVINTPARDEHKKRFPRQWLEFQMAEGVQVDGSDIPGFGIDQWDEINEEERRELRYLRFSTVEQIAGASDTQIQRIGVGGASLRNKAKAALRKRLDNTVKEELQARDQTIAELKEKDRKREEEMAELREMMKQLAQAKKPGRPKKVVEA